MQQPTTTHGRVHEMTLSREHISTILLKNFEMILQISLLSSRTVNWTNHFDITLHKRLNKKRILCVCVHWNLHKRIDERLRGVLKTDFKFGFSASNLDNRRHVHRRDILTNFEFLFWICDSTNWIDDMQIAKSAQT